MRKTVIISLNGTNENRFMKLYGFTQNPFPNLSVHSSVDKALKLLAAEPIPDTDYIRKVLDPIATKELIDLCCKNFKKGEYVSFNVHWEES